MKTELGRVKQLSNLVKVVGSNPLPEDIKKLHDYYRELIELEDYLSSKVDSTQLQELRVAKNLAKEIIEKNSLQDHLSPLSIDPQQTKNPFLRLKVKTFRQSQIQELIDSCENSEVKTLLEAVKKFRAATKPNIFSNKINLPEDKIESFLQALTKVFQEAEAKREAKKISPAEYFLLSDAINYAKDSVNMRLESLKKKGELIWYKYESGVGGLKEKLSDRETLPPLKPEVDLGADNKDFEAIEVLGAGAYGETVLYKYVGDNEEIKELLDKEERIVIKTPKEGADLEAFEMEAKNCNHLYKHNKGNEDYRYNLSRGIMIGGQRLIISKLEHKGVLTDAIRDINDSILLAQVLDGMNVSVKAVNDAGVIHKDIACRNFLVPTFRVKKEGKNKGEVVKITAVAADYGLSNIAGPAGFVKWDGKLTGPLKWMSNKALSRKGHFPESDLYALKVSIISALSLKYGASGEGDVIHIGDARAPVPLVIEKIKLSDEDSLRHYLQNLKSEYVGEDNIYVECYGEYLTHSPELDYSRDPEICKEQIEEHRRIDHELFLKANERFFLKILSMALNQYPDHQAPECLLALERLRNLSVSDTFQKTSIYKQVVELLDDKIDKLSIDSSLIQSLENDFIQSSIKALKKQSNRLVVSCLRQKKIESLGGLYEYWVENKANGNIFGLEESAWQIINNMFNVLDAGKDNTEEFSQQLQLIEEDANLKKALSVMREKFEESMDFSKAFFAYLKNAPTGKDAFIERVNKEVDALDFSDEAKVINVLKNNRIGNLQAAVKILGIENKALHDKLGKARGVKVNKNALLQALDDIYNQKISPLQKAQQLDQLMGNYYDLHGKIPKDVITKYGVINQKIITEMNALLTSHSQALLRSINPDELNSEELTKRYGQDNDPFQQFAYSADAIEYLVITSVLNSRNFHTAILAAKRWLSIAADALNKGNFHSLFAIYIGLNQPALKRVMNYLTSQDSSYKELFENIEKVFDPSINPQFYKNTEAVQMNKGLVVVPVVAHDKKAILFAEESGDARELKKTQAARYRSLQDKVEAAAEEDALITLSGIESNISAKEKDARKDLEADKVSKVIYPKHEASGKIKTIDLPMMSNDALEKVKALSKEVSEVPKAVPAPAPKAAHELALEKYKQFKNFLVGRILSLDEFIDWFSTLSNEHQVSFDAYRKGLGVLFKDTEQDDYNNALKAFANGDEKLLSEFFNAHEAIAKYINENISQIEPLAKARDDYMASLEKMRKDIISSLLKGLYEYWVDNKDKEDVKTVLGISDATFDRLMPFLVDLEKTENNNGELLNCRHEFSNLLTRVNDHEFDHVSDFLKTIISRQKGRKELSESVNGLLRDLANPFIKQAIKSHILDNFDQIKSLNFTKKEFEESLNRMYVVAEEIKTLIECNPDPYTQTEKIADLIEQKPNLHADIYFLSKFARAIVSTADGKRLDGLLKSSKTTNGLGIFDLLIKPTQWLTKYPTHFEGNILKHLEEGPERERVLALNNRFKKFNNETNETVRKIERVQNIQNLFGGHGTSTTISTNEINDALNNIKDPLMQFSAGSLEVDKLSLMEDVDNLISMIALKIFGKAKSQRLEGKEIIDLKTMFNDLSSLIYFAKELRGDALYYPGEEVVILLDALGKLKDNPDLKKEAEEKIKELEALRAIDAEKLYDYINDHIKLEPFDELRKIFKDRFATKEIPSEFQKLGGNLFEILNGYADTMTVTEISEEQWNKVQQQGNLNAMDYKRIGSRYFRVKENRNQDYFNAVRTFIESNKESDESFFIDILSAMNTIQNYRDYLLAQKVHENGKDVLGLFLAIDNAFSNLEEKLSEKIELKYLIPAIQAEKKKFDEIKEFIEKSTIEMPNEEFLPRKLKEIERNQFITRMKSVKPFAGYEPVRPMSGGANEKGEFAGVYAKEGQNYHIKCDSKKGKPRTHKIIAEVFGGSLIQALIGNKSLSAEVSYLKANKQDDIYVASKEFEIYRGDFWKFAYELYNEHHPDGKKNIPKDRPRRAGSSSEIQTVMREALEKIQESNKEFKKEFAEIMVASLLVGDFDVHIGNVGVTQDEKGAYHLVRLDFGGALRKLSDEIHPHSHSRHFPLATVMPGNQWTQPTNHFREYPREFRVSEEMANELERQSQVDLSETINKQIQELSDNFDESSIKVFAEHIGLKSKEIKSLDKDKLLKEIKARLVDKMTLRQTSLKQFAFEIRASLCFDEKGQINGERVKKLCESHKKFVEKSLADGKLHLRTEKSKGIFIERKYRKALLTAFKSELKIDENVNVANPKEGQYQTVRSLLEKFNGAKKYLQRLIDKQLKGPKKVELQKAFKDIKNVHLQKAIIMHLLNKPFAVSLPEKSILNGIIKEINELTQSSSSDSDKFFENYINFLKIVEPITGLNDLQNQFIAALIAQGNKPKFINCNLEDLQKFIDATKAAISFVRQIDNTKAENLKNILSEMETREKELQQARKTKVAEGRKTLAEEARSNPLTIGNSQHVDLTTIKNVQRVWIHKTDGEFEEVEKPTLQQMRDIKKPVIIEYSNRLTYKPSLQVETVSAKDNQAIIEKMVDMAFEKFKPESVADLTFSGNKEMVEAAQKYAHRKIEQKGLDRSSNHENGQEQEKPQQQPWPQQPAAP